jgi:hypothetical protein
LIARLPSFTTPTFADAPQNVTALRRPMAVSMNCTVEQPAHPAGNHDTTAASNLEVTMEPQMYRTGQHRDRRACSAPHPLAAGCALAALLLPGAAAPTANTFKPPDVRAATVTTPHGWHSTTRSATLATDGGRTVLNVAAAPGEGVVWQDRSTLQDGAIEIDLRGRDLVGQSFLGVAFRGVDDRTYDAVFFRPFNFATSDPERRLHAVQYHSSPNNLWARLRAEHPNQYEKPVTPVPFPNDWFHVRIALEGWALSVFVNGSTTPTLAVTTLEPPRSGAVGVWVGNGSGGEYANLRILPRPAALPTSFRDSGLKELAVKATPASFVDCASPTSFASAAITASLSGAARGFWRQSYGRTSSALVCRDSDRHWFAFARSTWDGAPGGALERLHDSVPGPSRLILGWSLLVEHRDVTNCLTFGVDAVRCHGQDFAVSRDRLRASAHNPSSSFLHKRRGQGIDSRQREHVDV